MNVDRARFGKDGIDVFSDYFVCDTAGKGEKNLLFRWEDSCDERAVGGEGGEDVIHEGVHGGEVECWPR